MAAHQAPRRWDSPGKNTGVGCHFLLQCMNVKSESEVAQSCPTLSDPMDCSLPGSSFPGIFQARVLEWGTIAFSGGGRKPHKLPWVSGPWLVGTTWVLQSTLPSNLAADAGREPEPLCPSHREEASLSLGRGENPSLCHQVPLLPGSMQKAQPEPCSSCSPAG